LKPNCRAYPRFTVLLFPSDPRQSKVTIYCICLS
jgi:hypothetical protein